MYEKNNKEIKNEYLVFLAEDTDITSLNSRHIFISIPKTKAQLGRSGTSYPGKEFCAIDIFEEWPYFCLKLEQKNSKMMQPFKYELLTSHSDISR